MDSYFENFHQKLNSLIEEKEKLEKNIADEIIKSEKLKKIITQTDNVITDKTNEIKKSESKASEKWNEYKRNLELLKNTFEKTITELQDEIKNNKIKSNKRYNEIMKYKQKGWLSLCLRNMPDIFGKLMNSFQILCRKKLSSTC